MVGGGGANLFLLLGLYIFHLLAGEKKSLLSKLFGRKKKGIENKPLPKESTETNPVKETKVRKETKLVKQNIEYATFSAQFPPPEWQWYQDQHKRTKDWISQQAGRVTQGHKVLRNIQENTKDLCPYHSHSPTTLPTTSSSGHNRTHKHKSKTHTYHEIEAYKPCKRSVPVQQPHCLQQIPPEANSRPIKEPHHKNPEVKTRRSKSHNKKSHRHSMDVGLLHRQAQREYQSTQRNEVRVPPLHSSTPRENDRLGLRMAGEYVDMSSSPILKEINHADKDHRSRKRRSKHYKRIENDISYEYQGRLPRKHCNIGMSRDSGVNCIGLSENHNNFCYNQLMDYENVKSNNLRKSMEMQLNSLHQSEANRNEIVCVAEINTCAPPSYSDYVELNSLAVGKNDGTQKKVVGPEVSLDLTTSKSDDIGIVDSSEQSYDTVIHNKRVQEVSKETENLTLGDSGFYSPRLTEFELDKDRTKAKVPLYKNLTYDHHELNNLKDLQKEKIVLNNEFYKEPSPSSDYQVVGVV